MIFYSLVVQTTAMPIAAHVGCFGTVAIECLEEWYYVAVGDGKGGNEPSWYTGIAGTSVA
jgi:hypothetical protein